MTPLRAQPTLAEAFGGGVAYVRRPSPRAGRWLPREPGYLDFIGGGQNAIAGPMPVICAAATATPPILRCLRDAGFALDSEFLTYRDEREYLTLLRRAGGAGLRLALQSAHPPDEADPSWALVPPEIQLDWNDKGRLAEFVPAHLVPRRRVVSPCDIPATVPVVLKAAGRGPSGGGASVRICITQSDLQGARGQMAGEPGVVVEEYLDIVASACIHTLVRPDGSVATLGVAEQVCDGRGGYHGNWLDAQGDALVSQDILAEVLAIAARAAAAGYRGFAGIDVALCGDGSAKVLDLNFRVNGSTAAALLRATVQRNRGTLTIRYRTWQGAGGFADLLKAVRHAMERGTIIPLSLYDPAAGAAEASRVRPVSS